MRVALLSYRSKPHCGGQGVYVRHLSRELVRLGHDVEVFSGQPYPELDEGVRLTKVPSLDLYREPDPFRVPRLREFRDLVDVQEFLIMCTAGFPEPRTFARRVAKVLAGRRGDFDVVHDNQVLAHGITAVEDELGLPVVTTIHHPITLDRRIDLAEARGWRRRLTLRRWYGFLRMQVAVARRARHVLTPSESSKRDVVRDFGVAADRIEVIPLGVDDGFVPPTAPRVPGRLLAMASADAPMKGIATLLEAFAKLRVERPELELYLVTKPRPGGRTEQLVRSLDVEEHVHFVHGVSEIELVELMGSAEIACVPSLYEGFSLPDRRADGLRHAARGVAGGRDPRGGRPGRRVRRPGDAGRRRRAGDGHRGPARRPGAPGPDGRRRPRPRARALQLAGGGQGDGGGVRAGRRRSRRARPPEDASC